jgi:hypothetical protein
MQSKQSKECSVFSYHKTWSNLDRPVSYQTKLSSDSSHMRYNVIIINKTIIDQNSNQYNQNRNHIRYDLPQHNYNRYQLNTK